MNLLRRQPPIEVLDLATIEARLGAVPSSRVSRMTRSHDMPLRSRRNSHPDWSALEVADDLPLLLSDGLGQSASEGASL